MNMTIFAIVVAGLTAISAARKGYNLFLWFLSGGIIGLLILAFLPFVNEKSDLPEDERARKKKTGNLIGAIISAVAIGLVVLSIGMNPAE